MAFALPEASFLTSPVSNHPLHFMQLLGSLQEEEPSFSSHSPSSSSVFCVGLRSYRDMCCQLLGRALPRAQWHSGPSSARHRVQTRGLCRARVRTLLLQLKPAWQLHVKHCPPQRHLAAMHMQVKHKHEVQYGGVHDKTVHSAASAASIVWPQGSTKLSQRWAGADCLSLDSSSSPH